RLGECGVTELAKRLRAERKRRLELRDELFLGPLRLHGIRRRQVGRRNVRLHRTERVAEQVAVARDVLRDVADRQLLLRRLVAELRLRYRIECLRDGAVRGQNAAAQRRGDRVRLRRRGLLCPGHACEREGGDRNTTESHTVSGKGGGG